jgi:hypothetical protein
MPKLAVRKNCRRSPQLGEGALSIYFEGLSELRREAIPVNDVLRRSMASSELSKSWR